MDDAQVRLVQDSWARINPLGMRFVRDFYARLFDSHPELEGLFPDDMASQENLLYRMFNSAVSSVSSPAIFDSMMTRLGIQHGEYGLTQEHYAVFTRSMLQTMQETLDAEWTADHEDAWQEMFQEMCGRMLAA
ncbi:MAG: hypothetical protein H7A35_16220 [Planctomycetales bacterium]|nr:hypothetical protein [bacterium]UNM08373.1 MAG: hypothetical protein H7A35_16220 [Planctomycetales bacterium]